MTNHLQDKIKELHLDIQHLEAKRDNTLSIINTYIKAYETRRGTLRTPEGIHTVKVLESLKEALK